MLIDKEGRIFGKINLIDFIVLLFMLLILPMSYYGYRLYKEGIRREEYIQLKIIEDIRKEGENKLKDSQEKYHKLQLENSQIANEHISSINDYNNLKTEYEKLKSEYIGLQDKVNSYLKKHKREVRFFK